MSKNKTEDILGSLADASTPVTEASMEDILASTATATATVIEPDAELEIKPEPVEPEPEPTSMKAQLAVKNAGGGQSLADRVAESRKALDAPLPPGQKFFESPEGFIMIASADEDHVWCRDSGVKGARINPKR